MALILAVCAGFTHLRRRVLPDHRFRPARHHFRVTAGFARGGWREDRLRILAKGSGEVVGRAGLSGEPAPLWRDYCITMVY